MMQSNTFLQPSVGADLSHRRFIGPLGGCDDVRINLLMSIIVHPIYPAHSR